jgi:putative ABC transport system permease protein
MSRLYGLRHRLYVLLRGDRYDDDVRRELRFHRELDRVAGEENSLGNETYYREEVRRMTLHLWTDRVRQDLAYAWRGLRRAPGFTVAIALMLGLGVGVNAAMYSLLDRVFVRVPRGVVRPGEVRRLYVDLPHQRFTMEGVPYPWLQAIERADSTVRLSAFSAPESVLVRADRRRLSAMRSLVTADYFSLLGVRPERGRFFAAEENDIATPTPVAVLSDAFWRRGFAADPAVLGRRVKIGTTQYTIVGVAQPAFSGIDLDAVDVWSPANNHDAQPGLPGPWYTTFSSSFRMIARVHSAGADQRIATVGTAVLRPIKLQYFISDSTLQVLTGPIIEAIGPMKQKSEVTVATRVAGVAVLVLVIVMANVMNLLLLRATRRQREIAVRRALGISRGRLVQQVVTESLCLAALGAVVATVFSIWASRMLRALFFPNAHWALADGASRAIGGLEPRVVLFVLVVSVLLGFAGGLVPALQALRPDLSESLKAGMSSTSYRSSRLRNTLLVSQVALCVVLLTGAGLFIRSLDNVRSIGTGFDGRDQFFATPTFDEPASHRDAVRAAFPLVADRLRSLPEIASVGYASLTPLRELSIQTVFLEDRDSVYQLKGPRLPLYTSVTPDYFRTVGLRLETGRDFSSADGAGGAPVTIVSARAAKVLWPGESPIGKCLFLGTRDAPCSRVVGVVSDAHETGIIERPFSQFYVPFAQAPKDDPSSLAVRARPGQSAAARRETEKVFRDLIPDMSGISVRTFDTIVEAELRPWRLGATLFSALGLLALVIAAIGVYAVVAYGASQRTHEIVIRVALGAQRRDVMDLIVRDGVGTVGVGIGVGIAIALLLGRLIASLLFGVLPHDPSVLIGAAVVLCAVGMMACFVPARRAARLEPASALRAE